MRVIGDELIGRRVALLLMSEDEKGEDDWAVAFGTVEGAGEGFVFQHSQGSIELEQEWLDRAYEPEPDLEEIFEDAEVVIPLTLGPIPEGADMAQFEKTGLKWPSS